MSEPEQRHPDINELLELLSSAEEIEELLRQFARKSVSAREDRFPQLVVSAMEKKFVRWWIYLRWLPAARKFVSIIVLRRVFRMLRTIWLGLISLLAVGAIAAVKFMSPHALANVPAASEAASKQTDRFISPTEGLTTVGSTLPENEPETALAKSDRMAALSVEPIPIKTIPVTISPPRKSAETLKQPVKIVSRHWRDPMAPKLPGDKAAKSKSTKKPSKPLS
jgi:hypothetical protein